MIVKLNDREITLKRTMRSYMLFESITGKAFSPKTITDIITYFYAVVLSSDKDVEVSFDEFIDYLDSNEGVYEEFQQWIIGLDKIQGALSKKKKTATKKPKK